MRILVGALTSVVKVRSISSMASLITVDCPESVSKQFLKEFSKLPEGDGFRILNFPRKSVLEKNALRLLEKLNSDAESGCKQSQSFLSALKEYAASEHSPPMLCSKAPLHTPVMAFYFTSLLAEVTGSELLSNPLVKRPVAIVAATNEEGMGYIDDSKKEIDPHTDQPGYDLERFALACISSSDSEARTYFIPHGAILEKLDPKTIEIGFEKIFVFNRDGKPASILVKDLHGKDSVRNFDFDLRGFRIEYENSNFSKKEIIDAVSNFRGAIGDSFKRGEYESVKFEAGQVLLTLNGVHFRDRLEAVAERVLVRAYYEDQKTKVDSAAGSLSLSSSMKPTAFGSLVGISLEKTEARS